MREATKMPKSLLDLMSKEDAEKARARAQKRLNRQRSKSGLDVSPEIYMIAEFGYYFGWAAVKDLRQGFIEKESIDGSIVRDPFTLEEAALLLEGARKVWYTKLTEQGHANLVANMATYNDSPGKAFNEGIKPFTDRAEVKA